MDFNRKLKQLEVEKSEQTEKYRKLQEKRAEKIEAAVENINNHYNKLLDMQKEYLDVSRKDLSEFKDKILKFSSFKVDELGAEIADILRIYEAEDYVYAETYDDGEVMCPRVFRNDDGICKVSSAVGTWWDPFIERNGPRGILLSHESTDNCPCRAFYYLDVKENLKLDLKWKRFPYVKEFIDNLISYRIENNLESISSNQLKEFKKNFILDRVEEIENYHYESEKRERKEFEIAFDKKHTLRQDILSKKIKRAANNCDN